MLFKRFKLNFLVVAGLMLAFIGFASLSEARAQELCPGVPFDNGWLRIDVTPAALNPATFTAGLMGSIETDLSATRGGIDWLYNDDSFLDQESSGSENNVGVNTNAVGGSQLVGWWSQKGDRSTHVQVSVASDVPTQSTRLGTDPLGAPLPLSIHVQLLDENCVEILDFCDSYTPLDSHIYDLANLVTNAGVDVPEAQLVGNEGTILITTVVSCPTDDRAISYDFLFGTSRIINTGKYDLGTNLWARDTLTATPLPTPDPTNPGCTNQVPGSGTASILNGSTVDPANTNTRDCRLRSLVPTQLSQNFSILPTSVAARADVVLINFADSYNDGQPTLGYVPLAATSTFLPDIVDVNETPISCPSQPVCFARLGIDDAQLNTDTPLPTPTPTPSPSPSPGASPSPGTSPGASPTPSTSPNGGGGGGGSCAIAGTVSPASASALADILIPLLPVFGFGLARAVSRRRKEEK